MNLHPHLPYAALLHVSVHSPPPPPQNKPILLNLKKKLGLPPPEAIPLGKDLIPLPTRLQEYQYWAENSSGGFYPGNSKRVSLHRKQMKLIAVFK